MQLVLHIYQQYFLHRDLHSSKRHCVTSIDPMDIESVELLVKKMDTGSGTDVLMYKLSKLYDVFLPSEYTMRRLSLLQQKFSGNGCIQEFCITCVYVAAMGSLLVKHPDKIKRIQSHGTFDSLPIRKTGSCLF